MEWFLLKLATMKSLVYIAGFLSPILTFAQHDTLVNDEKFNYYALYSNGNLKELGNIKNKLKTGHWVYYHDNGQKEKEGEYHIINVTDPPFTTYITPRPPAKKPIKIKPKKIKQSAKAGHWHYWDKDGKEIDASTYEKLQSGKLIKYAGLYLDIHMADSLHKALKKQKQDSLLNAVDSIVTYYPAKTVTYRKGQKPFKEIIYYESGTIHHLEDYNKKMKISHYENGRIEKEQTDSSYSEWYPDGKKRREIVGGTEIQWYETGEKKMEKKYVEGSLQVKYWWKNGQLMTMHKFISHTQSPAGIWPCWNKDGSLLGKAVVRQEGDTVIDGWTLTPWEQDQVIKQFYKAGQIVKKEIIKQ